MTQCIEFLTVNGDTILVEVKTKNEEIGLVLLRMIKGCDYAWRRPLS